MKNLGAVWEQGFWKSSEVLHFVFFKLLEPQYIVYVDTTISSDDVVFPHIEDVPLKFAIPRRNKWMVEQADVVIAYVTHSFIGAATTIRYAYQKKKKIIRLISNYDVR